MAITRRWNIDHLKESIVDGLGVDLLSDSPRVREAARKCAIAMESQNQKDEQSKANELLGRIIGTLAELGVDLASLGITQEETRRAGANLEVGPEAEEK